MQCLFNHILLGQHLLERNFIQPLKKLGCVRRNICFHDEQIRLFNLEHRFKESYLPDKSLQQWSDPSVGVGFLYCTLSM